jgi:hypothetical protein
MFKNEPNNPFFTFKNQNSLENEQKKGTLKIQKSQIAILVLNQSPNSMVFSILRFPGGTKTVQVTKFKKYKSWHPKAL